MKSAYISQYTLSFNNFFLLKLTVLTLPDLCAFLVIDIYEGSERLFFQRVNIIIGLLSVDYGSIFINAKKVDVFSSKQPEGLMTKLMGENMMRKDGKDHLHERRIISPSVSPKTVKNLNAIDLKL